MGKLLVWVVLIALVWLAYRLIVISQRRVARTQAEDAPPNGAEARSRRGGSAGRVAGEKIVPCAHCGIFLPASEALHDADAAYCSGAHLDAHRIARRDAQARRDVDDARGE